MPYKKKQMTKKVPKAVAKYVKKAIAAPREKRFAAAYITNRGGFHNTLDDVYQKGLYDFIFPNVDGGFNHRVGSVINATKLECSFNFCNVDTPNIVPKVRIIVARQPWPAAIGSTNLLSNLSGNKLLDIAGDPEIPQLHILHDKVYDLCAGSPTLMFNKVIKFNVNLRNKKIIYNDDRTGMFPGHPPNDDLRVFVVGWQSNTTIAFPTLYFYDAQMRLHFNEA